MLNFWFKATWRDRDGWEITHTFNRYASNRKEAERHAREYFDWFGNRIPRAFGFVGIDFIKVEEV